MPLRSAVYEGENKKPEVGPSFIDLLLPEVLHYFKDQKRTCSESP